MRPTLVRREHPHRQRLGGAPGERRIRCSNRRSGAGEGGRGSAGRTVGVIAATLLLATTLAGLYGLATGRFSRWLPSDEPTPVPQQTASDIVSPPAATVDMSGYGDLFSNAVDFPDAQQERAVRAALGLPGGEAPRESLLDITELYFCGNMTPKDLSAVAFDAEGNCAVNGAPVVEGKVADLSLLGAMPYLETLALICQPVDDLSGLNALALLRELSLAGCASPDLATLGELPSLETLRLEHSGVRDLSVLGDMPALRTVTVSADMIPLT